MSRPVSARTRAICKAYRERTAKGADKRVVVTNLANELNVERATIYNALRSGEALSPCNSKVEGKPGRPIGGGTPGGYGHARPTKAESVGPSRAEAIANARPAPHPPCWRCDARADVGCKHQPPSGPPPVQSPQPFDRRSKKDNPGPGRWAFHPCKASDLQRAVSRLGTGSDR